MKKIYIEIMHNYLHNCDLRANFYYHEQNIALFKLVNKILKKLKISVSFGLLIDDIHWIINNTIKNNINYLCLNLPIKHIFYESAFKRKGRQLIGILEEIAKKNQNIKIFDTGRKRIEIKTRTGIEDVYLWEKGKEGDMPSCDVIDTSYQLSLIEKYNYSAALIVLPGRYRKQQARVRKIFALLGKKPNIMPIYF